MYLLTVITVLTLSFNIFMIIINNIVNDKKYFEKKQKVKINNRFKKI